MDMTLKKSRLALELALSIHRMYAGPWIQRTLDAQAIQLLYEEEGAPFGDFTYACIQCELNHDWQATNNIWQECQMERDLRQTSSGFFLSFAQLLVDIFLGKRRQPPLTDDWHASLIEEADRMMKVPLLKRYGEAVLGCIHFPLDYKLAKDIGRLGTRSDNSASIAREVILKNIVQNLWDHFHFWKSQYDHQVSACSGSKKVAEKLRAGTDTSNKVSPNQSRSSREQVPVPFFTLFADGDEKYDEM